MFCAFGGAGYVGDPFGDIPDKNQWAGNVDSNDLSMGSQYGRNTDISDDEQQRISRIKISQRISILDLRLDVCDFNFLFAEICAGD